MKAIEGTDSRGVTVKMMEECVSDSALTLLDGHGVIVETGCPSVVGVGGVGI
jgi:hypothetical protein